MREKQAKINQTALATATPPRVRITNAKTPMANPLGLIVCHVGWNRCAPRLVQFPWCFPCVLLFLFFFFFTLSPYSSHPNRFFFFFYSSMTRRVTFPRRNPRRILNFDRQLRWRSLFLSISIFFRDGRVDLLAAISIETSRDLRGGRSRL